MKAERCTWAAALATLALAWIAACGGGAPLTAPSQGDAPAADVLAPAAAVAAEAGTGPTVVATPEPYSYLTREMLVKAIDGEYYASALYHRVLVRFGQVAPFDEAAQAEEQHAAAVGELFLARGWRVPPNPYGSHQFPTFAKLAQACSFAADTERRIESTYLVLDATRRLPADAEHVFGDMIDVTANEHIPAFLDCAGRDH